MRVAMHIKSSVPPALTACQHWWPWDAVACFWNAGNGRATPTYSRHAAGSGCAHAPGWRQCMVPDGHKCRTSHACAWGQQLGLGAWLPQEAASLNNKQWQQQNEMTPCIYVYATIILWLTCSYLFNQALNKYILYNIMISGFSGSHWYNSWLELCTHSECYTYMQHYNTSYDQGDWCLVECTCVDRDLTPSTH